MTLPLTAQRFGRPDWTTVEAAAGLLYICSGVHFGASVESQAVPVWPWPTVQLRLDVANHDAVFLLRFWDDPAMTVLVRQYNITVLDTGIGYASFPAVAPFASVKVQQANPANDTVIGIRMSLTELPVNQLPDKETIPSLISNANVGGGGGVLNLQTGLTWDGDVDFLLCTDSVSSDITLSTTDFFGNTFHYYKALAVKANPLLIRRRLHPSPALLTVINHDAAAKLYVTSMTPVCG